MSDTEVRPAAARGRLRPRRLYRPQMLPTLLTMGNLFCGFLAIAYASDAMMVPRAGGFWEAARLDLFGRAGWMIFLGMVFDLLDGHVARLAGATSPLGAQLDSLADMVTFGVAPAFLAKGIAESLGGMDDRHASLYFSVFFALMAALRLARYNVQHGDPEEARFWFEGLPTPGAAGVIAGIAVVLVDCPLPLRAAVLRGLPWVTLGLGVFMISRLPFAHFGNRLLRGRKPVHYLVVGLIVLVLTLAFRSFQAVLAISLLGYALSGPVVALFRYARRGRVAGASPGGGP